MNRNIGKLYFLFKLTHWWCKTSLIWANNCQEQWQNKSFVKNKVLHLTNLLISANTISLLFHLALEGVVFHAIQDITVYLSHLKANKWFQWYCCISIPRGFLLTFSRWIIYSGHVILTVVEPFSFSGPQIKKQLKVTMKHDHGEIVSRDNLFIHSSWD